MGVIYLILLLALVYLRGTVSSWTAIVVVQRSQRRLSAHADRASQFSGRTTLLGMGSTWPVVGQVQRSLRRVSAHPLDLKRHS
jgi:hypothetical protein